MSRWAILLLAAGCAGEGGPGSPPVREMAQAVPGTGITLDLVYVPGTSRIRPFWISKRPVAWAEFDRFYEFPEEEKLDGVTRPSSGKNYLGLSGYPAGRMEPHLPVTSLRIHSAIAFCEWLSRKTGCTFRLPTEPEWEQARISGPAGLWEYCLEPDRPPDFGPVLRRALPGVEGRPERRPIPAEWEEADPNRPFSTWWFRTGFSQGFRVVRVSPAEDLEARTSYGRRIEISALKGEERTVKIGTSVALYSRITGEVRNGGDRVLSELVLKVYFLTPKGIPHMEDVTSNLTRRATFNICMPVLASSAHGGDQSRPLGPGERRAFAVDVPLSLDADEDVCLDRFGAAVLSLRFDEEHP